MLKPKLHTNLHPQNHVHQGDRFLLMTSLVRFFNK